MNRLISPVVYEENSIPRIQDAFARGCSGVIVECAMPDSVAVELQELESSSCQTEDDARNTGLFRATPLWLQEVRRCFSAAGMTTGLKKAKDLVWFGGELIMPWHIDKSFGGYCDVHVHLLGKGMLIASPPEPIFLPFDDPDPEFPSNSARLITRVFNELNREDTLEIIQLQPNQMLVFNERCLHKTSSADESKLKLRAAIIP